MCACRHPCTRRAGGRRCVEIASHTDLEASEVADSAWRTLMMCPSFVFALVAVGRTVEEYRREEAFMMMSVDGLSVQS